MRCRQKTEPKTEPIQPQPNIPRWNLALRIAFRFWLVYLGLYCLATQIITSLFTATEGADFPDPATRHWSLWSLKVKSPSESIGFANRPRTFQIVIDS
jgi:hypothetical protein